MALHQQKLNYTSPLWCVHQSWHTQMYLARPNNQPYANGCGETLDQNSKTQSSSLRLPHRTSIRLLSRISKFEALDALSGPTRLPSMRPAHLQLSQSSISGKRTDTSHTRRLSTIFSPTSDNREQYTTFPSEDEFTSGRDILGSTPKKWFPSKKLGLRKLRKSQVSFKSSSIRMRGGVRDPVDVIVDKGIEVAREPYAPKEVPLKKRTIRDMIRFYDGSTDNNASKAVSKNTRARPSVPTTTQVAPLLRNRISDIKLYSDTSTTRSRGTLVTDKNVTPTTPTKSCESFADTQRQPLHGKHTPSSIIYPPPSPSKSSIRNVSPRTVICSKACHHRDAKRDKSPMRGTPNRHAAGNNRQEAPSSSARLRISVGEDKGWTLFRIAGKESPIQYTSLDRRKFSDKIEELYRAKSLEKNNKILQVAPSPRIATAKSRNVAQEHTPRQTERQRELGRAESRVADMKERFEGSVSPRAPIPTVLPSLPLPLFSNISPFSKVGKVICKTAVPPPPPPVFHPSSDTKRKSNMSPRTVEEHLAIYVRRLKQIPATQELPTPITVTQKQRTKTSSNIRDRIKLFESMQGTKKPEHEKIKSSYTRKIRTSIKSLFEATSQKTNEDGGSRGLSSQDVKEIADEFQDKEVAPTVRKRNTPVGSWNIVPQVPPSSRTDGAMSEKGIGSPYAEGVKEMIVKEVECGLKQPKPVRVTEMKRMVLLCGDRVGGIMDKERSRVAQSRKL